ncbi:Short-chain dehydrogenase TIC 32, chloroplastic [Dendrobium catenatum]|uniref:Short-chain dehydrogenase TIC 32, chloroplastic n=1 Tax=Dendrobium catenatum TaxID=906689 RepID=A0A2I0W089_9ASPA|nr:Short-chain dehydrogenase TIC 32, chloroplastic [Dendrobium catenatum]
MATLRQCSCNRDANCACNLVIVGSKANGRERRSTTPHRSVPYLKNISIYKIGLNIKKKGSERVVIKCFVVDEFTVMQIAMISFMQWISRLVFGSYIWSKLEFSITDALRYIMGIAGPNGFGSNSTAEQVTEGISPSHLTAIITGATSGIGAETARVLAKRGVRLVMPARDLKKAGEGLMALVLTTAEQVTEGISPSHLTAIITGATSGIGAETARVLAKRGVRLVMPARDLKKAGEVKKRIKRESPGAEIIVMEMDLSHYLLTKLLLGKMAETATKTGVHGRIINVTSVIHRWVAKEGFKFDDMLLPKSYNGTRAYALSKLANIMHAKEMARQLKERNANVTINSVHPGIVKTGIIRDHRGLITDDEVLKLYGCCVYHHYLPMPLKTMNDITQDKNETNCADYRFVYIGVKGIFIPQPFFCHLLYSTIYCDDFFDTFYLFSITLIPLCGTIC